MVRHFSVSTLDIIAFLLWRFKRKKIRIMLKMKGVKKPYKCPLLQEKIASQFRQISLKKICLDYCNLKPCGVSLIQMKRSSSSSWLNSLCAIIWPYVMNLRILTFTNIKDTLIFMEVHYLERVVSFNSWDTELESHNFTLTNYYPINTEGKSKKNIEKLAYKTILTQYTLGLYSH